MSNDKENRRYPRVVPHVNFSVMVQHVDKVDMDYFEGLIEDVSHGGGGRNIY